MFVLCYTVAMQNDEMLVAPKPDPRVFRRESSPDTTAQLLIHPQNVFMVKTIEYTKDKGTLLHYHELLFPQKGFPYVEVIWAMNLVKKNVLGKIRILAGAVPIMWPILFVGKKRRVRFFESVLEAIANQADYAFDEFYIKPELYCPAASTSAEWTFVFLVNMGVHRELSGRIAQVVAMIMEYDNAYRYRVQDIVGETSAEALKVNPRKEIRMMIETLGKREPCIENTYKFALLARIISLLLFIPSIKRAFITSIPNIELIKQDEADKYHCLFRSDYDYQGLPFEVRWKMLEEMHGGSVPKPVQVGGQPKSAPVETTHAESQPQTQPQTLS